MSNMKTTRTIIGILIMLFGWTVFAQQNPQYTEYMYNMTSINPAYVGTKNDLSIRMLGRMQWLGINGAPDTQTLSVGMRAYKDLGAGFSVVHDKIGLAEETNLYLDFSYTFEVSRKGKLSFGIKNGYTFFNDKLSEAISPNQINYSDVIQAFPGFGFGVYYRTDKFYAGFSVPNIFETPRFKYDPETNSFSLSRTANFFATSGRVFKLDKDFLFKPSTMIKFVKGAPVSIDLNLNLLYKERFELGASYRYNASVQVTASFSLDKHWRIGYAYDYALTNLRKYNSGSHEVILSYDLNFRKYRKVKARCEFFLP